MAFSRLGIIIITFSVLILSGCKKGVPEISSLRELDGFSLDQSTISTNNKSSPTFSISGRCNPNFTDVEISLDGGSEWIPLSSLATTHTIDCAGTGTFSANLSFAAKPLDISKWTSSGTYSHIQVRGFSELGYSAALSLVLNSQSGGPGRITAGGSSAPLTGGAYKMQGQVSTFSNAPALTGGTYKLQGEILW